MKRSTLLTCTILLACCAGILTLGAAQGPKGELAKKYTETITTKDGTKLTFDMVLIPGGTFTMGSPAGEADRAEHEGPQRQVQLSPFYLCTTETTLELFLIYYQETGTAKKEFAEEQEAELAQAQQAAGVNAITGPTPVYGDMTMGFSKKHPAIGMTWHNATTFCRWLEQKTGKKYRLPTEAEWEYAARAGTTSAFGVCDTADGLKDFAWHTANANMEPHAVGTRKPNAWGLYDMQGNVREWVQDFYSPTAYEEAVKNKETANPTGPKEGKIHVARGGFHDAQPGELRCAARAFEEDWWRMNDPQIPKSKWWLPQIDFIGIRVACEVPGNGKK
ncbi:MAG: formylglycine-generating enzyme family protein [Planctomycetes bacterium]|nr:formylglycine-generating enzyme family protein [Planctomycetota bacterium]